MHPAPRLTVLATALGVARSAGAAGSFRSRVLDVTVEHIKKHGPDHDVARQVSSMRDWAWTARDRLAEAAEPWLDAKRGEQVAAALEQPRDEKVPARWDDDLDATADIPREGARELEVEAHLLAAVEEVRDRAVEGEYSEHPAAAVVSYPG